MGGILTIITRSEKGGVGYTSQHGIIIDYHDFEILAHASSLL